MAKYQKYAEYKESGVEWLAEIPSDWKIIPLKFLVNLNPKKSELDGTFRDKVCSFIPMEKLKRDSICLDDEKNISEVFDGYTYFINDDILLAKVTPCFENKNIAIANNLVNGVGFGSTEIYVLRVKQQIHNRYMFYRLQESNFMTIAISAMTGAGGLKRVPSDILLSHSVACPSYKEQIQIANFLDHETTKIDSLITKQEKLIELLKEKRQSVISHAVTKGLNPDVPMKDSGVEWLGEVPEHWILSKLKWRAVTTSGSTPSTSKYELYYEDGSIPWIRTTDLNNDDLYETPISITPRGVSDTACSVLPVNSILIAMYGGAGSIGKHSLLKFESTINQAVCGVLPSKYFNSDYLHRFYEFYRPFWMIGASGTRKDPNIGQDHIKEALVPLPPLEEQVLIANFITEMQTRYDAITQKAELAIQLMQERRTALISSAVTGKINVSNWQHPNEAKTELSL